LTLNAILVPYKFETETFLAKAMEKMYLDEKLREKFRENNLKRAKDFDKKFLIEKWNILLHNI
jgi:hypothetical protein